MGGGHAGSWKSWDLYAFFFFLEDLAFNLRLLSEDVLELHSGWVQGGGVSACGPFDPLVHI